MTTGIRLNKMLSQAGIASRRGADDLIAAGRVRVNGKVMDKLGARVDPETDEVKVDGRAIGAAAPKVTILLNKPDNVVCTLRDPQGRTTVSDLLKGEPYKVRPVGRLDFHTEGVLLMTTDGELANRLLHPSHKVPKVYVVKVGGRPEDESIEALRNGVKLDDGTTEPAMVDVLDVQLTRSWLQLVLTQGKKRQVRRMCEAVGHRPLRVVRTSFSTLEVGKLRPGQFRYLTNEELDAVYNVARLPVERAAESGRAAEVAGRTLGEAWRRKGPLPGEEGWAARREEDEAWQGRERVDQDTRDRRGSPGGDRKPRGDDRKGGFRRDEREERQPRGGDRKGGFRRDDPDVRDGDRKPRSGGRAGGYQRGDRNDDRKPRSGGRAGGYQRDDDRTAVDTYRYGPRHRWAEMSYTVVPGYLNAFLGVDGCGYH